MNPRHLSIMAIAFWVISGLFAYDQPWPIAAYIVWGLVGVFSIACYATVRRLTDERDQQDIEPSDGDRGGDGDLPGDEG